MKQDQSFPIAGFQYQLILKHLLIHAAKMRPEGEIVYKDVVRENYEQLYERCQRFSNALRRPGRKKGIKGHML